jgi:Phosphotransferase enzyme family
VTDPIWEQPSWRAQAEAWIDQEVERLGLEVVGTIEQPHVRPWSTVLRIPTSDGDLYFKASAPVQAFEVPLLAALMDDFADRLPPVLAFDADRAWLLMRDGGTPLRELVKAPPDLRHWLAVVPLYAELQLGATARVDELLQLGVTDLRLEHLSERFAELVERADVTPAEREALGARVPGLEELCNELLQDGIPATLQHNDLHAHNVLLRDGCYRLFDWGDSSISHPFQTMRVTIRFAMQDVGLEEDDESVERLRDAYLEPWTDGRSRASFLRSFELARTVGGVSDVLTEDRTVTAAGLRPSPQDPRSIPWMLRALLDEL